jgi:RsiW-degrading membrane proteinase PrsW (M82 family)
MTSPTSLEVLILSLIGGVIPAIIWLLFWLQEDKKRPEPRGLVMLTFLVGMFVVLLVIPFQKWTQAIGGQSVTFLLWATIEEIFKFAGAYFIVLRRKEDNEPIDPLIYMMTIALGFAAMENTIFIFNPLIEGDFIQGLITGNVRFIGASLLHTLSSAAIGISMGLVFYKDQVTKKISLFVGILVAIVLHTAFNLFIIKENSGITFATLGFVWVAIIILMLFFEKIKTVYPVNKI